jgi:subtilisin family serine protease
MKHTAPSESRTAHFLHLVVTLVLVLGLSACTEKVEEEDGAAQLPSNCPLGAPASLKAMSTPAPKARSYSEQPQVVEWADNSVSEVQAMGAQSEYVAVYDKACVAQGGTIAFPQEKQQILASELNYPAVAVVADPSDSFLRAQITEDKCLKTFAPNGIVSIQGVKSFGFTPNDALFPDQKHHEFLESEAAWDIFYHATNGISGGQGDIIVAVVDTGVNTSHEDLVDQLWEDEDGNYGKNYYNVESDDVSDDNGHGTHVVGLIAAQIENAKGGAGVAPRHVKIMAVKALGGASGTGQEGWVVNGINWAVQNGAHVINLSLGISGKSSLIKSAIENAIANGVFVVAASGNSNQEISEINPVSPAYYAKDMAGFMSVGSLDTETGIKSSFSNYSATYVEIFAPGSRGLVSGLGTIGLWSTVGVNGHNTYEDFQGTSMASPIVAAAAALAIGLYNEFEKNWTPALIEQHIKTASMQSCSLWDYGSNGRYLNLKQLAEVVSEAVDL